MTIILIMVLVTMIANAQTGMPTMQPEEELIMAVEQAIKEYRGLSPEENIDVVNIKTTQDWTFGTITIFVSERIEAPELFLFLAKKLEQRWYVAIEYTQTFQNWVKEVPDEVISPQTKLVIGIDPRILTGDTSAQLSLPWAVGETWWFTGGPHPYYSKGPGSAGNVWSSLDFSKNATTHDPVLAAREGTAYLSSYGYEVRIKHKDGWETSYYHLINIVVKNGEQVSRGQLIGYTSAEGGTATGSHVHFSLLRNGVYQSIDGHELSGWTIHKGQEAYDGCMTKDGVTLCVKCKIYHDDTTSTTCGGYDEVLSGTIRAGETVNCRATHSIRLISGFHAEQGSYFRAYIE